MRSLLRKESFPICRLAPSEVKSSTDAVATMGCCTITKRGFAVNAFWGRTKAAATEEAHAKVNAVKLKLTILSLMYCDYVSVLVFGSAL
mmetsp:Transcript_8860/g.16732  ORF Transcript_8860/g.16732 Transcript_8860/m.16732 type:complete len:89 (+) Transcript_8860:751-1017(+)